ncbi:MAG TPA: sigma 54-interacting transcriptional regulator [Polyangia bacterium]|nr:sigma 54-interacting transcriptional regulator [Polyangia bacterium]
MPAPKTPETTVPSDETRDVEARERLAIRWLYPGLDGQLTALPPGGLVLGRGDDCDVVMSSAETSRRHAEIRREGPLWIVRDLGSRNGTFVNGQRVSVGPLSPRDLLRFGDWIGVLAAMTEGGPGPVYETFAPGLYGGPALRPTLELARRAAASLLPVIVEGETGTGKEGLCRAIATWSGRTGPFLAVNCAAIPESLAEAELFGYRKGAFTGAERASPGYFRAADGGTLMLDEIVDLAPPVQTKLLRALEQREVVPLGESTPVPIDVRVVVAAQEPLAQAVKEKRFRADLYARLNGVTLRLPPLRERTEEIPFLFLRLLQDQTGGRPPEVEARAIERLCLYDWPFNLRELDLLVKRLQVMRPDGQVRRSDLPETMMFPEAEPSAHGTEARAAARPPRPRSPEDRQARDEQDLAALKEALRAAHGNVVRAAEAAGMTRQRAYRLMGQRTDIKLGELRAGAAARPVKDED